MLTWTWLTVIEIRMSLFSTPSTEEWIKMWYMLQWNTLRILSVYTSIILRVILFSHKKEQHNAICSNMGGTRDTQTKWNKSERERETPYDITYNWNLIYNTNEHFHRKENHGLGEWTCGCQGGRGMDWESGVDKCKLLHLEWMGNEILLCSTVNYVWLRHIAVQEKTDRIR